MANKMENVQKIYNSTRNSFDKVLVGYDDIKDAVASSLLCDSNARILFMGNTGFGKTTLASFLSSAFKSQKIRLTNDTLPREIIDILKNHQDAECLWLEEFNRMNSALQNVFIDLFAEKKLMLEDGTELNFNNFYVFATQNDTDISGIFNVPQAVYDRFHICLYFDRISRDEKRTLLFENFVPSKCFRIPSNAINYVENVINNFPFTNADIDILLDAFAIIENMQYKNQKLFAGSNIRGEEFMIKMATISALVDGRSEIFPIDIAKFTKFIFMHRIDQRIADIGSKKVLEVFAETEEKILSLKRSFGKR